MKVLVTGASGFLGRHVLAALRRHGVHTVATGRHRPQPLRSFGATIFNRVDFIQADLLATENFAPLIKAAGATHLLHLAWYAEHGKYWASPVNEDWTEATTRLVQAFCEAGGKQVVAAGTCAEYEWFADSSDGMCREDSTPLKPASLYGSAKDRARQSSAAICERHQVPLAWGRIFLPYGAGESAQRLIPSVFDVLHGRRAPFSINATASRDFLHASDVAGAFVTLLETGANGAFNVSSAHPRQLGELVRAIANLAGADPEPLLALAAPRSGEPAMLAGENLKLKALGWQARLSMEAGLQRALEDYAAAGAGGLLNQERSDDSK
ncbi:NAD(P)-dependent oxidoreductase [soil metagenome]